MNFVIVIVSHGNSADVNKLISDIDMYVKPEANDKLKIAIIENTLSDDECVKSAFFDTTYVRNFREHGFGENNNVAVSLIPSDTYILLNPDVRLVHDIDLSALAGMIYSDTVYSFKILNNNRDLNDFYRPKITIYNLVRRKLNLREIGDPAWISGCSMIIPQSVYQTLCGFDEAFFMYLEDCDLCLRAIAKGYKIQVLSDVEVIHEGKRKSRYSMRHLKMHLLSLMKYFYRLYFTGVYKGGPL